MNDTQQLLDRASALNIMRGTQGWALVIAWLNQRCDKAEFDLIQTTSSDPLEIIGLQRAARSTRAVFDGLQQYIEGEIKSAELLLQQQREQAPSENEPLYG
jgi:hypothetical protein